MKVNHGDRVKVKPVSQFDEVWLDAIEGDEDPTTITLMLTPEKARKLARKINRAASVIEIKQKGRAIV